MQLETEETQLEEKKCLPRSGQPEGQAASWALGGSRPTASAAPDVAWQPGWRAVRTEATGQSGSPGRTIATTGTAGSLPFPPGLGDCLPVGSWDSRGLPFGRACRSPHAVASSSPRGPPAVSLGSQRGVGFLRVWAAGEHGVRGRRVPGQCPRISPGKPRQASQHRGSTEDSSCQVSSPGSQQRIQTVPLSYLAAPLFLAY